MILLSTLIARFGGELHKQFGQRLLPGHLRALQAMESEAKTGSPR